MWSSILLNASDTFFISSIRSGLISILVLLSPFVTASLAVIMLLRGSLILLLVKNIRREANRIVVTSARSRNSVDDLLTAWSRSFRGILIISEPSTWSLSLCAWHDAV